MPHPTIIGPYRILNRIASGGMGTVYLARHERTQQMVALKVLSPQVSGSDEFLARFRREAQMVASLYHPHIVPVFDAGSADGVYFIAMAYLPYGSLKSEIRRYLAHGEVMSVDKALEIVRQIASALEHAHRKGLVHRDVKPSNILRANGERYVLSDFGIALDLDATRLTRNPDSIGTPEYMSPEQIERRPVDARSDVYALGVVLYELLTGFAPFRSEQALVTLMRHVHEAPEPITLHREDVPRAVLKLVDKALAKQPKDRFQSASELVVAIESLTMLADRGLLARLATLQAQCQWRGTWPRWIGPTLVMVLSLMVIGATVISSRAKANLAALPTHQPVLATMSRQTPKLALATVQFVSGAEQVIVRGSPHASANSLAVIQEGQALPITGKSRDGRWLQVRLPSDIGWVAVNTGKVIGSLRKVPEVPFKTSEAEEP